LSRDRQRLRRGKSGKLATETLKLVGSRKQPDSVCRRLLLAIAQATQESVFEIDVSETKASFTFGRNGSNSSSTNGNGSDDSFSNPSSSALICGLSLTAKGTKMAPTLYRIILQVDNLDRLKSFKASCSAIAGGEFRAARVITSIVVQ
jgi:hypothetical protein